MRSRNAYPTVETVPRRTRRHHLAQTACDYVSMICARRANTSDLNLPTIGCPMRFLVRYLTQSGSEEMTIDLPRTLIPLGPVNAVPGAWHGVPRRRLPHLSMSHPGRSSAPRSMPGKTRH